MTGERRLGKALDGVAVAPLSIALRCEGQTSPPALLDAFGGLLGTGHEATEQRTARREGNAFVVDAAGRSLDGRRCTSTTNLIARLQTEVNSAIATHGCAAGRVILYAGTFTLESATGLLVGTSGAGKTIFTAALVAEGARYLSDEFALLDPASGAVQGYPKPLTVKHDARGLLSRFPQLGAVAALDDEEDPGVRHVPLAPSTLRREAPWPSALLLLDADPESAEGWQTPADVVIEFAEHSPCRAHTFEPFPPLATLAPEVPAYRLARWEAERVTTVGVGDPGARPAGALKMTHETWQPTRAPEVPTEDFGDALVLYDPRTDRFHRLNAAGRALWLACDGNRTAEGVAAHGAQDGVQPADAIDFLRALTDAGLVD